MANRAGKGARLFSHTPVAGPATPASGSIIPRHTATNSIGLPSVWAALPCLMQGSANREPKGCALLESITTNSTGRDDLSDSSTEPTQHGACHHRGGAALPFGGTSACFAHPLLCNHALSVPCYRAASLKILSYVTMRCPPCLMRDERYGTREAIEAIAPACAVRPVLCNLVICCQT